MGENVLLQIKNAIDEQGQAFEIYKKGNEARWDQLKNLEEENRDRLEDLEARAGRPGKTSGVYRDQNAPERWVDLKSGEAVPVLEHKHRMSDVARPAATREMTSLKM